MPKRCCAVGCVNSYSLYVKGSGIQFYRFPADPNKRHKWTSAVNRDDWTPNEYTWICSEHFVSGVKSANPLAPNYIPTIFKHVKSPEKRRNETQMVEFKRRQATKRRRLESALDEGCADPVVATASCSSSPSTNISTAGCMTDINMRYIDVLEKSQEDYKGLKVKYKEIEEELAEVSEKYSKVLEDKNRLDVMVLSLSKQVITEENLVNDDKKVKYYTGLPSYLLLKIVFDFVTVGLPKNYSFGACSTFQQFLITMMKLRLNVGDQDLAYSFGISQATVSRCFNKWVDVLYTKLAPLVEWPEREELLKTMPTEFRKHFSKCVIIIDCFEVFMERPTSLLPRAQT